MSGALLKRIGVRNEVMYACGGHTAAKALIEGKWRLWDVDGFKGVIPLTPTGTSPPTTGSFSRKTFICWIPSLLGGHPPPTRGLADRP